MHGAPRAPRDRRYSTLTWRRVREEVRARDGGICQACGRIEPTTGRKRFPVDHKVPGADFYDPAGLWLLCWSCNTSKAGMSVEEWEARARRPVNGSAYPARTPAPSQPAWHPPARPVFLASERAAMEECAAIRALVQRWEHADKSAWPILGGEPGNHDHPRRAARYLVTMAGATWTVCPPECSTPARWAVA